MKIKSIVLYSNKGERKTLDFALDKVNLITGEHDTGKSALIPIVNYCLGHSDFDIPGEIIKNSVSWYAVLYDIDNIMQVFVAKPKPKYGNKEHDAFYKVAEKIDIPKYKNLIVNSSDYYIKKDLSILLRESLALSTENYSKIDDFNLTIDYTNFYLFQPIKVIVNNEELFYQQRNVNSLKIIRKTLPYFLGAKNEDDLYLQEQLTKKDNEFRTIKHDLKKYQENIKTHEETIKNFFIQAQSLDLIGKNLLTESIAIDEMAERLKFINYIPSNNFPIPNDFEPELRKELEKLQNDFNEKIIQLNAIKSYNDDISGYSKEANEHQMRLQSIGLFEHQTNSIFLDNNHCPLCQSELTQNIPDVSAIKDSLNQLSKNLRTTNRDKLNTDNQYKLLEEEKIFLGKSIKETKGKLCQIVNDKKLNNNFLKKIEQDYGNIREFMGRVKQFFENSQPFNGVNNLEEKQKMLEQEVDKLKSNIQQLEIKSKHTQKYFDDQISAFASKIDLSYRGSYLFDWNDIDITVSDGNSLPVSMKSMGGLDIPGCHLITLLALHKCFAKKSPVPNFLVLDQLIQGYSSENKNVDTDKINKMIQLILDVSKETGLQVILTEHDDLPQPELYHVEKERWTAENALIPKSWIK